MRISGKSSRLRHTPQNEICGYSSRVTRLNSLSQPPHIRPTRRVLSSQKIMLGIFQQKTISSLLIILPIIMTTTAECKPKVFRIGILNVNAREYNADRFAFLIDAYELDIFSLHECGLSLAHKIRRQLGQFFLVYAPANYEGNALFSRFPIASPLEILAHVEYEDAELRSAAAACISLPIEDSTICGQDGSAVSNVFRMWVIATHLSHIYEADRLAQVKSILQQVQDSNVSSTSYLFIFAY
jgi:hypothetical protein